MATGTTLPRPPSRGLPMHRTDTGRRPRIMRGARRILAAAVAVALLPAATPSGVTPIELSLPIDCTLGEDCYIQNYVDADPGGEAKDFTCGPLAYNNHQGTDFRLRNRAALTRPYSALAAASGTVVQVINNQPDHHFLGAQDNPLGCGNAVMIDHGGGWTSQYCHLAQGSVRVRKGQQVQRGEPLGHVGSSGGTDYPHLHYAIRVMGATIDPFTGVSPTGCEAAPAGDLWAESAGMYYAESAILGFGATSAFPSIEAMENGTLTAPPGGRTAPFYIWAHLMGVKAGDTIRFMAFEPQGRIIASELFKVVEDKTIFSANIGVEPSDGGFSAWPPGAYQGRMVFYRNGAEIADRRVTFTLPSGEHVPEGQQAQYKN